MHFDEPVLAGVTTVAFDVGETLVDERRYWATLADRAGIPAHVVWAALGATIESGVDHREVWGRLGVSAPDPAGVAYARADLYPDAASALTTIRRTGRRVVIAGNQPAEMSSWGFLDALEVDLVATSGAWGVRKPELRFFERLLELVDEEPARVAYVGDRLDLDVAPAQAAGLFAVHLRRGPWGLLRRRVPADHPDLTIDSLTELCSHLGAGQPGR